MNLLNSSKSLSVVATAIDTIANLYSIRRLIDLGKIGVGTAIFAGVMSGSALADPPPPPPIDAPPLPKVFCFRFTDIRAVVGDPEGDRFQFEFEVLNWANAPVTDVSIKRNVGTKGKQGAAPFFAGASVDPNGRPIGDLSDRPPGNQNIANNWAVSQAGSNQIKWNVGSGQAIPHIDLKGIAEQVKSSGGTTQDIINQVNSQYEFNPDFNPPNPQTGSPGDPETIDNGPNVLDGFVLEIDDFDINEVISFNWMLDGLGIDPSNEFGSGVVNLARVSESFEPIIVFPGLGNTGTRQTALEFAGLDGEEAGIAKASVNPNSDANFALEFGAISRDELPQAVPEPFTILGSGLALGFGALFKREASKKRKKS